MKKAIMALMVLTSFSSFAATLDCKAVNPEETIYNIKALQVPHKAGVQEYLIREDKIADTLYRTYLEERAEDDFTPGWFLNKYEVLADGSEEIRAEIEFKCEVKN